MKEGDEVTIVVKTPWATTEEKRIIESISKGKIYIEDLNIPFDKKTGQKTETFPGSEAYIKEIVISK